MLSMRIRQNKELKYGYNSIIDMTGKHADALMDFGILKLSKGQQIIDTTAKERAFLLISGEIEIERDGCKVYAKRSSCFYDGPWCLHVPSNVPVKIGCIGLDAEISVYKTNNEQSFDSMIFTPEDCKAEMLGTGTLNEMATRVVRTIFNKANREKSNLLLGETINFPGKWSSYPPHYHPQPEIYFYKFNLNSGFGYSGLGDKVYKIINNDTLLINSQVEHPQVAAPGYAMYYTWAIRHLDNLPFIKPTFLNQYSWLNDKQLKFWPDL
jgi:5-deoxy-glucuronate isomerase